MNVLLLTWSGGENNPFAYFNACLQAGLEAFGVRCFHLDVDDSFAQKFDDIAKQRIDVAITHQGLYTHLQTTDNRGLWDALNIKLVSLHGDHPCHMPGNHATDSRQVLHLYSAPSYVEYAEKYFARQHPVFYYVQPNYFRRQQPASEKTGRYFVLPKNLDDTVQMKQKWRKSFPEPFAKFLNMAAEAIAANYRAGDLKHHHAIIDELLTPEKFEFFKQLLKPKDTSNFFHLIHGLLDKVYRNTVSESILHELKDVPLHIIGRGWDRFKKEPSPHHVFADFGQVSDGDAQFQSEFGIVDVTPIRDSLHDRSARAIGHGNGFLCNSQLNMRALIGDAGTGLFYTGKAGDLRSKAENVMADPLAHRMRAQQFGDAYDRKFSFYDFYVFLASLKM